MTSYRSLSSVEPELPPSDRRTYTRFGFRSPVGRAEVSRCRAASWGPARAPAHPRSREPAHPGTGGYAFQFRDVRLFFLLASTLLHEPAEPGLSRTGWPRRVPMWARRGERWHAFGGHTSNTTPIRGYGDMHKHIHSKCLLGSRRRYLCHARLACALARRARVMPHWRAGMDPTCTYFGGTLDHQNGAGIYPAPVLSCLACLCADRV